MRPAAPGEPDSLPSETDYRVLVACETALGPVACVEARPRTGRQHQLRVHLRAAGAPLLVDPLYGRSEDVTAGQLGEGSPALSRLTLHAAAISFRSPACGDVTVTAPLPADLSALAGWLGGTAAG